MLRTTLVLASLLLLPAAGCSAESKAASTLDDYEKVFGKCKELHDEMKMEPGEHPCVGVTSKAVEMGLKHSGLEEEKWRPMLEAWLEKTKFTAYYKKS